MARTKKSSVKKPTSTPGRAQKKKSSTREIRSPKLFPSLTESIENLQLFHQVSCALGELRVRAKDVKEEASKEVEKLMKRYDGTYKELERKMNSLSKEAKKQAQVSMMQLMQKWYETKEKLPSSLTKEMERLLEKIGIQKQAIEKAKAIGEKAITRALVKKHKTERPQRKARTTKVSTKKPSQRKTSSMKGAMRENSLTQI